MSKSRFADWFASQRSEAGWQLTWKLTADIEALAETHGIALDGLTQRIEALQQDDSAENAGDHADLYERIEALEDHVRYGDGATSALYDLLSNRVAALEKASDVDRARTETAREIAARFGRHYETICDAVARRTWNHLEDEFDAQ